MREEVRNGQVRHSRDDMASETEMGDLLYGLVKMLKPQLVVETGCYVGDTAIGILKALQENGSGRYVGCDTNGTYILTAKELTFEFAEIAEFRCVRSEDLPELREADLIFSDSGGGLEDGLRLRPMEYDRAKPGACYVVHDTQWGQLAAWMRGAGGIVFDAGRGFGIGIKP